MATTYTTGKGFFDRVSKSANEIDYDYDSFIDYDDTGSRWELSAFLMKKDNTERVNTAEFYTWEGEYQTRIVTLDGAVTSTAASLTLDATAGVRVDDILHVATADEDGEHVRVTAVDSATGLSVQRLNATPTGIADNAELIILGGATSETASSSATASYVYPNRVTNRVMIIRRAWEWSLTEDDTALRTDGKSPKQKADQAKVEFRKDQANLAWWSISTSSATTGVLTSKGIIPQLAGNAAALRINAGGALAYSDIADVAEGLMEFSDTTDYMVFSGTKGLSGLAELGASSGTYNTNPSDNIYGFKGQAMQVGDMRFMFTFERTFKEGGSVYDGYAVVLSLKNIKAAHLGENGPFRRMDSVQDDPGGEIRKSQFRAQWGIKMQTVKRHGYIHGLT